MGGVEGGERPLCKGFKTLSVLRLMRGSGEESRSAVPRSVMGGRGSLKAEGTLPPPPSPGTLNHVAMGDPKDPSAPEPAWSI